MSEIEVKSPFDGFLWGALQRLLEAVDTVDYQAMLLTLHKNQQEETGDICGAVVGYVDAFPELVKAVQEAMDIVASTAMEQINAVDDAIELFSQRKLEAMANCPKPDCPDREDARRELGWNGDELTIL